MTLLLSNDTRLSLPLRNQEMQHRKPAAKSIIGHDREGVKDLLREL
jgi:hypothetical protein